MQDFIGQVRDPRVRELLERAIAGRGAFRRFKDALQEHPELRRSWFSFHDARMERRAIEWLADQGLVDPAVVDRELQARIDPELPEQAEGFDPVEVAAAVAGDLRVLYGPRLRRVLLFGSWARAMPIPSRTSTCWWSSTRSTRPGTSLRRWTRSCGGTPTRTMRWSPPCPSPSTLSTMQPIPF